MVMPAPTLKATQQELTVSSLQNSIHMISGEEFSQQGWRLDLNTNAAAWQALKIFMYGMEHPLHDKSATRCVRSNECWH